MIDYWHHPVVRPSVTLYIVAFRVGVQDQRLYQESSYLSVQTLLLWDVSFSHKTHRKNSKNASKNRYTTGIVAMVLLVYASFQFHLSPHISAVHTVKE